MIYGQIDMDRLNMILSLWHQYELVFIKFDESLSLWPSYLVINADIQEP